MRQSPMRRGLFITGTRQGMKATDEKKPARMQAFFVLAEQAGFEPAVGY